MKKSILKCASCGIYTMKGVCPACGKEAKNPKPPKFSIEDKYADYRRKAKADIFAREGLI